MAQASMIISGLITIVGLFVTFVVSTLPTGGLPDAVASSINSVAGSLNAFSYIFPVGAVFNALYIVIGYEAIMWGYHALLWIWKKLPFIGK